MEGFDPEAVDEILGLPARGLRSVAILALGYRDVAGDWLANLKGTPVTVRVCDRRARADDPARPRRRCRRPAGVAMVWMTVFHFCFDLNHFGHIHQNLHRSGVDLAAQRHRQPVFAVRGFGTGDRCGTGQSWPRFWRRWAQVVGCAGLVTAGSC
jgi:hypothetical protein